MIYGKLYLFYYSIIGTHYHSNTGGSFGNPAGKAEVGRFLSEAVRGLSEYNLTGLGTVLDAFVSFKVFKAGGLFNGTNDFPFNGPIQIDPQYQRWRLDLR
jgi:hypothetical protein